MRAFVLGIGAAFALAGAAAAQPAVLIPSKPIHGTAPSFKAELPKAKNLAASPEKEDEVVLGIDQNGAFFLPPSLSNG